MPAADVVRIVARADWDGPAIDALTALGALGAPSASAANPAARVMVVRSAGHGEQAIYAAGAIDISDVEPSHVLALPMSLAPIAPRVAAIIVAADGSLSLLLNSSAGEELWPRRS